MTIPIIIDCDPGHDDAVAILLALASPEVDLLGITTVAGNTTLPKTTVNALRVLELAGRPEIPVAAGCDRPLMRDLVVAESVHGKSGLDGPRLGEPTITPAPEHAVDFMADLILTSPEPITLVPVGPLTNVAMLFNRYPEVIGRIPEIVSMGGAMGLGNVTPSAEFNIFVDPEAALRVYQAGVPITMVGLDVTHQAVLTKEDADQLRGSGSCGRFVAELLDFFISNYPRHRARPDGAPIHDALAVAHLIWPGLMTTEQVNITVDVHSELSRGRTVVDRWGVTSRPPNAAVGVGVDSAGFSRQLVERISSLA